MEPARQRENQLPPVLPYPLGRSWDRETEAELVLSPTGGSAPWRTQPGGTEDPLQLCPPGPCQLRSANLLNFTRPRGRTRLLKQRRSPLTTPRRPAAGRCRGAGDPPGAHRGCGCGWAPGRQQDRAIPAGHSPGRPSRGSSDSGRAARAWRRGAGGCPGPGAAGARSARGRGTAGGCTPALPPSRWPRRDPGWTRGSGVNWHSSPGGEGEAAVRTSPGGQPGVPAASPPLPSRSQPVAGQRVAVLTAEWE